MADDHSIRQVPGLYRKRVGDFIVTAVNDGLVSLPPEVMIGMEADEIRSTLTRRFRPGDPARYRRRISDRTRRITHPG